MLRRLRTTRLPLEAVPPGVRRPGAVVVLDPLEAAIRVMRTTRGVRQWLGETGLEPLDRVERVGEVLAGHRLVADLTEGLDERLGRNPVAFGVYVEGGDLVGEVPAYRSHVLSHVRV